LSVGKANTDEVRTLKGAGAMLEHSGIALQNLAVFGFAYINAAVITILGERIAAARHKHWQSLANIKRERADSYSDIPARRLYHEG
jgi:hypothetical protein